MDTFQRCRMAFEKASWSYEDSIGDLTLDFDRRFLPKGLCGQNYPAWLTAEQSLLLNQIRGYSYAHLFVFIEQFIVQQTHMSSADYMHVDSDALSTMLKFADEELKHQRMFERLKDLIEEGLPVRPNELAGKETLAEEVCSKTPMAVYLVILATEWLTQRHYLECFKEDEDALDASFVKVFRLHWAEEAQHARADALELQSLASGMDDQAIQEALTQAIDIFGTLMGLLADQSILDVQTFERIVGDIGSSRREELLSLLTSESCWTFVYSGLEHNAFVDVYRRVIPETVMSAEAFYGAVSSVCAQISQSLDHSSLQENAASK